MNLDTKYLLRKLRWKTKKFNLDGSINNYGMLYCQKVGLVDSWFIRFYASIFLAEEITLFPGRSLVSNHGLDGTGTHCEKRKDGTSTDGMTILSAPITLGSIPIEVNQFASDTIKNILLSKKDRGNALKRFYRHFKSFIRRLLYIDCL